MALLMSYSILCAFIAALLCAMHAFKRYRAHRKSPYVDTSRMIRKMAELRDRHPVADALHRMIHFDGAGTWPSASNHDGWPTALRPYQDIYWKLLPMLATASPSLDDSVNERTRALYRDSMRKMLREHVYLPEVERLLSNAEYSSQAISRDVYNAFYCCIAVCRHAYRWAMIPVVKVAQREEIVSFPQELDAPWQYLQRAFGVTADSGNNTANVVLNFDRHAERRYKINILMPDHIQASEDAFFRMFFDVEVYALPVYYAMVLAVVSFEDGDFNACLLHLRNLSSNLKPLHKVFYDGMVDSRIQRSVWLSYVQGFQGWGVGRMINGQYVKYDGLSGNHVLAFQAIDAFLGLSLYLTEENMVRYIPCNQRNLVAVLRDYDIRSKAGTEHDEIRTELEQIAVSMKRFRAAHRARVMSYLRQPAPERLAMTAGKSVIEDEKGDNNGIDQALAPLDEMLRTRIAETK